MRIYFDAEKNTKLFFFVCRVQGAPAEIDPDDEVHEDYLSEFKSMMVMKLRESIDRDLINDSDCIKGRKKTVQVTNNYLPSTYYLDTILLDYLPLGKNYKKSVKKNYKNSIFHIN